MFVVKVLYIYLLLFIVKYQILMFENYFLLINYNGGGIVILMMGKSFDIKKYE